MTPLPWFPFYVDDFLASPKVRRMDAEHVGVYLLLLLEQWQSGPIPKGSEDELAGVMRTHSECIADVLHSSFEETKDGWVNRRLQRIEKEQRAKSESARRAAKARWDAEPDADAMRMQSDRNAGPHSERNAIQNQNQNQKKETTTSEPAGPVADMWRMWLERFGGPGRKPTLTAARSAALKRLYDEQLKGESDPMATFGRILDAVQASDHHMSKREYQYPDSLFRNDSRRDRWADIAMNGRHTTRQNGGNPMHVERLGR